MMKAPVIVVLTVLVAALSLGCCKKSSVNGQDAGTKTHGSGGHKLAVPTNDLPGLPNFARVSDGLYRGAQPTAEGFAELKKMGVKTIVNLRSAHSDTELLEGLGLNYVAISFKPWHPEEEDIFEFLKVVADPGNRPVFVHCQHGADRTGTMVAIYRVAVEGWDMREAMEEMPNFGFHSIWDDLKEYLLGLDPKNLAEAAKSFESPPPAVVP
jgi:tyrosine-protein phosphatase SIW14